ncbi:MAG: discoidin domain-containing protein [Thermoanaerobaculales bacterium]
MTRTREHALVGALFVVVAIVMTWPLAQHLGSLATDQGDPLLNSWIMSWDAHRITTFSFRGFFDANIFFPYHRTLNYSEHLIPEALVGLAPLLLTGNPLFACNIVWLLAMASSAFATYLLARRLTGSMAAAVFAGIAYGFSLFMMSQLPHLQVLCAAGLPLSFYFLHRFCAGERVRDVLYLGVTVAVQMLANGYYAVILPTFLGVALVHYAIAARRLRDQRFLARILLLAAVIAVIAGPFLYQYATFRAEMGFSRTVDADATLSSYLSAPAINRLWGHLTARFWRSERMFFPGLVTLAAAVIGVGVTWRRLANALPKRATDAQPRKAIPLSWLFNGGAALLAVAMLVVLVFGYFRTRFEVQAHDINHLLLFLLALLLLRLAVDSSFRERMRSIFAQHQEPILVYGEMLTLAFILSLGGRGPFRILNRYVPGFDAIRAFPRIHVFFTLALAVFAAFGLAWLQGRLTASRRRALAVGACGLLLAELACLPLPLQRVDAVDKHPPVEAWLAAQNGDDWGVAELPFPSGNELPWQEIQRVYVSTRHWKRTMSGYSGYFPPLWHELRARWDPVPLADDLEELRGLGLRFVVVHAAEMHGTQRKRTEAVLANLHPPARLVADFGTDRVFELPGWSHWPASFSTGKPPLPIDASEIQATANVNAKEARLAIDGKLSTRWHTDAQHAGDYFQLDFGAIRHVRGVSLLLGEFPWDYPRGYRVEASLDGEQWSRIAERGTANLPVRSFLTPTRLGVDITFPATTCRYLRVTNLGSDPSVYWSIAEIIPWQ